MRLTAILAAWLTVAAIAGDAGAEGREPQDDTAPDPAWSFESEQGTYRLTLRPAEPPIEIGEHQAWIINVRTAEGEPVHPARIAVGGGMQAHAHGLPSQPQVTAYGGDGAYLIEGVRFSMEGQWRLSFQIESAQGTDRADVEITVSFALAQPAAGSDWTERERRVLETLALPEDPVPPPDPSNRYADNEQAAALGKRLFFDSQLSGNGEISCATCHQPDDYYTDGLAKSQGIGQTLRNAPSVVGAAYHRWFYWDGRRDSLWAQALIPFEAAEEMGGSRVAVVRTVARQADYRDAYRAVFGELPDGLLEEPLPEHAGPYGGDDARDTWHRLSVDLQRKINTVYANVGKAVAAFERTLTPPRTRFDRYVEALLAGDRPGADDRLTDDEVAGARLFMDTDKTQCLQCHNGPMLTNGDFHNIGTGNFSGERLDYGRVFGLRAVLMDEFNCLGPYSDAEPRECKDLRFLNRDAHVPLEGAFKVPSLRGLLHTAPYFHDGRFDTLRQVLRFYNEPPDKTASGPHELRPLGLDDRELSQLEAFLLTLSR